LQTLRKWFVLASFILLILLGLFVTVYPLIQPRETGTGTDGTAASRTQPATPASGTR